MSSLSNVSGKVNLELAVIEKEAGILSIDDGNVNGSSACPMQLLIRVGVFEDSGDSGANHYSCQNIGR